MELRNKFNFVESPGITKQTKFDPINISERLTVFRIHWLAPEKIQINGLQNMSKKIKHPEKNQAECNLSINGNNFPSVAPDLKKIIRKM